MFGFVKKATTSMHFIGWCMGKFHNETKSGEGGPAHPDDTLRGVRASTGMEDWKSLVAGPL